MDKGKFSIIIVPHDLKKTRTFRIPYAVFYVIVGLIAAGLILMIVFVATYGTILVRSQEALIYKRQIEELMKRQEQMGELRRNLAQLRGMNLQVRRMLGLVVTEQDSVAMVEAEKAKPGLSPRPGSSRRRTSRGA